MFTQMSGAFAASGPALDPTLELHYNFNSSTISGTTIADQSGHGRDGTLVNSPTSVSSPSGQALSFLASSSQYITTPYYCSALDPITIFIRMRVPASYAIYSAAFGCAVAVDTGFILVQRATDGSAQFTDGYFDRPVNYPAGTLVTDTWTRLAQTVNGTTATGYAGGVSVSDYTPFYHTDSGKALVLAAMY